MSRPNTKDTPVGKIPKEWEVKKVMDLFTVETGTTPSTKKDEYWKEGDILWLTPSDLRKLKDRINIDNSSRKITEFGLNDTNLSLLPKGSIILSTRAPVGYVALLSKQATFNQGCKGMVPRTPKNISSEFFTYYFLSKEEKLENLSGGSTFKELRKSILENFKIPYPPLPEQKKIADILGTVDETIQKVDEAIGKTERLKKGLMQNLLTKGIGHKEFKNTDIGRIPKEWEVVKVIDLFKVETGTTPSTKKKEYWDGGLINWFTPTDLSKLEEDIYIEGSERKITEEAIKEVSITKLQKGSLILSTRAPVGYIAILKESATFNQGCKGLIPKDINFTNSEFYCYYLQNKKYKLQMESAGSTFKELSKERIENFKIPYISILEQKNISEILNKVNKRIELLKMNKQKFERIKKGLMNDLLTGRKRVKV